MHDHEPCGVDTCRALAASGRGLCVIHERAYRAPHVCAGTRCLACKRPIKKGEWVTAVSTLESIRHVHCPPPHAAVSRKKDRDKPLFAAIGDTDAG